MELVVRVLFAVENGVKKRWQLLIVLGVVGAFVWAYMT